MADDTAEVTVPRLRVEPTIPTATEFNRVPQIRSVIGQLDTGAFLSPALLAERMLWNARLRGVLSTRINGLLSTDIRWEPARNNAAARRAALAMREDWPIIASHPSRAQFAKWSLLLGVSFGQRIPIDAPTSERLLPALRPYWPGFVNWDTQRRQYRIQTDAVAADDYASSPAMAGAAIQPSVSPWVIAEPFGTNSWRDGLIHAAWRPWLGREWGERDQNRASEKHGIGIIKAKYPRGTGTEHQAAIDKFISRLRTMPSEGVIPLEDRGPDDPAFDVMPFEFNGTGFAAIDSAMNAAAVSLAILFLGHNLTTEVKGGSFAAAGVADYIRDDVKNADAGAEWACFGPQLAAVWALWNYGDPELAPRAVYVTDSPTVNLQAAQKLQALGLAFRELKAHVPNLDIEALAEQWALPVKATSKAVVAVPEAVETDDDDGSAPDSPSASAPPEAQPQGDAVPTLALTPTDYATVATVDQALASVGLPPIGGEVGARFVTEHAAKIRAETAPDTAIAAAAESGAAPTESP